MDRASHKFSSRRAMLRTTSDSPEIFASESNRRHSWPPIAPRDRTPTFPERCSCRKSSAALAVDRAAAGPDLRFPRFTGRRERDGQMFPSRQVATANVPPVFRAASITERMQLIEEVIKTFVKDRAVGIVDPLGASRDVKHRTGGISLGVRSGGLDRSGRAGERLVHGFSSRAKRQQQCREQIQLNKATHRCHPARRRALLQRSKAERGVHAASTSKPKQRSNSSTAFLHCGSEAA